MSNKAFVDFEYNGEKHEIECTRDEKMLSICQKLAEKIGKDINKIQFEYLKEALDKNLTFEECFNLKKKKGAYGKFVGSVAKGLDLPGKA